MKRKKSMQASYISEEMDYLRAFFWWDKYILGAVSPGNNDYKMCTLSIILVCTFSSRWVSCEEEIHYTQ